MESKMHNPTVPCSHNYAQNYFCRQYSSKRSPYMSLYNTCSKLALKYSRDGSSTMLVVCYFLSQILKAFSVTITAPSLGCDFFFLFFSFLFFRSKRAYCSTIIRDTCRWICHLFRSFLFPVFWKTI